MARKRRDGESGTEHDLIGAGSEFWRRGFELSPALRPSARLSVRAHPRCGPMEHWTQLEIDGLQRAEGVLDAAETFVGAHSGVGRQPTGLSRGGIRLCGRQFRHYQIYNFCHLSRSKVRLLDLWQTSYEFDL